MERLRKLVPPTALGKVRLAAVVFACVGVVGQFAQVSPDQATLRRAAGGLALALLLADFILTHTRQRTTWVDPLLVTWALVAAGTSLRDPMAVIGLCFVTLTTQSLYGSHRAAVARILATVAAFPATIALAPDSLGRHISWHSGAVFGLVPMIGFMGVLMRALYAALTQHEQAAARETLLARTGSRLLGRTDVDEVRAIVTDAAVALCDRLQGVGLLGLRRDGDAVVVEGSVGFSETTTGAVLPPACVAGLDPSDFENARELAETEAIDRLVGGRRHWRAVGLATADADRFMLVGGIRRVADEVLDAFRTLATQWSLAEANCGAHMELAHRAHHDQLTALPNRTLFFQRLAAAVDATQGGADSVTLMIVDLDDFKQVNDVYGHAVGDDLLRQVAARLTEVGGELGVAARFGGDEFALLLSGLRDPAEADRVADRLRERLLEPFRLTKVTVSVGASIGLASATPSFTAGDLMRCADIAMYSAKAKGKNRVERYTEAGHGDIAHLRLLEDHLVHAVERGEIVLHYQPQIDLQTGRCVGLEALARWQHPTLGFLPPGRFIPLAEQTGQIVGLGSHVLRTACRQLAAWTELPEACNLTIAVNVAARQLIDPRFVDGVRAALRDSGLPAHRLTIELTESEQLDKRVAMAQLRAVAELGVRIAIDDFGTGYASLASLRSFPVHQLKIDRSFLADDDDAHADGMFRLVISVGQILELETVAEGVETPQQAEVLRRAGVPLAQGFLFARPMPAQDFPNWLSGAAEAVSRSPAAATGSRDQPAS
jgi:diguanylate cyclase (GGDEF)-like protein